MSAAVGTDGPAPGGGAPGADVGAIVDALRHAPDGAARLAALLPENLAVHANRSAAETTRIRGYLLAAFADAGLPDAAVPYVIESLESADSPYEIAGAALAVRGLDEPPDDVARALVPAVRALAGAADATVSFECYAPRWPYARPTTALTEVIRTIGGLGPRAGAARAELVAMARQRERWAPRVLAEIDSVLAAPVPATGPPAPSCCAPPSDVSVSPAGAAEPGGRAAGDSGPVRVVLEDQDGGQEVFEEYYSGKPAIVAFFYTRCDNPYKCSRTITGLAALQGALAGRGLADAVKVTAITYDPEFDGPARLRAYGRDRGVRFGADARFFRAVTGFAELRRRFDLGVNYGASTVNRHRIEVHLLDGRGAVAASFTRLQWTVDEVLAAVEDLVARDRPGGVAARCRC